MSKSLSPQNASRHFLTRRGLAQRYGVDPSTIDRWLQHGGLPFPLRPGGPRGVLLWPEDIIEQHERQCVGGAS